jgi:hypothetical protein
LHEITELFLSARGRLPACAWLPGPPHKIISGDVIAAADDPNAAEKIAQVCEANFYSGEWALRQGARDEAARQFRIAARDCPKTLIEANAAVVELKPLGATPSRAAKRLATGRPAPSICRSRNAVSTTSARWDATRSRTSASSQLSRAFQTSATPSIRPSCSPGSR